MRTSSYLVYASANQGITILILYMFIQYSKQSNCNDFNELVDKRFLLVFNANMKQLLDIDDSLRRKMIDDMAIRR